MSTERPQTLIALAIATILIVGLATVPAIGQSRNNEAPSFNESAGCGQPAGILPPMADVSDPNGYRGLPSSALVRGPWAAYFGRTYPDVRDSLVLWTVPMSGGQQVWVHERGLSAFQEASRLLAIEQTKGHYYQVRLAATFSWRRVGGSYRMSQHSFGNTIDINWDTNPYIVTEPPPTRGGYTDMPEWFVSAWRSAGFCWGGDWSHPKDAMHFSWMGPLSTPGVSALPPPFRPDSLATDFKTHEALAEPGFGPQRSSDRIVIVDASRDGAPDIVRVRVSGQNSRLLSIASASHDYSRCGVTDVLTSPLPFSSAAEGLADLDGDSQSDFWIAGNSGSKLSVAFTKPTNRHAGWTQLATEADIDMADIVEFADRDRDGSIDLYALEVRDSDIRLRIYSGASSWTSLILDKVIGINPVSHPFIDIADRGGDGSPDVIAASIGATDLKYATGSSGYVNVYAVGSAIPTGTTIVDWSDWDGDGRDDMFTVDAAGAVAIYAGGSISNPTFWFLAEDWGCTPVAYPAEPYDFNGDGYGDITASAPDEDIGTVRSAGAVVAGYGSETLTPANTVMLSQGDHSIRGNPERNDHFGTSTVSADFNRDGYADLAVGVNGEDVAGVSDSGLVSVIFGSEDGFDKGENQWWDQNSSGVPGVNEAGDRFGSSLATGDFNNDGYPDLAVGSPGESIRNVEGAGAVTIFYGDRWKGLRPGPNLHQNRPGVSGVAEKDDHFGESLAAGDFNDDGYDDLVVGSPGEGIGNTKGTGLIHLFSGGGSGIAQSTSTTFHIGQASSAVPGPNAGFASALSSGDIDGDGYDDLAVGAPSFEGAGAVFVLVGGGSGLSNQHWPYLVQGPSGLGGWPEEGDRLGFSIDIADFNGDGYEDIAVGVPGEDFGMIVDAGMVYIVPGAAAGPNISESVSASQARSEIWGSPEINDSFGWSIRSVDIDHDGAFDLAIGVPGEDLLGKLDAGIIAVVPGEIDSLVNFSRSRIVYQGSGLGGGLESGDLTGS